MPTPLRQLPPRPSLEQLQKQAKELLRQLRATSDAGAKLADAQFQLAVEYGYSSWAALREHLRTLESGTSFYEEMARRVAEAYMQGSTAAIREVNHQYGAGFMADHHQAERYRELLPEWYASTDRSPELALRDARRLVAHYFGYSSWDDFRNVVAAPEPPDPAAPIFLSSRTPFYRIDWSRNRMTVRGPQNEADWDLLFDYLDEHNLTELEAEGLTGAALSRLAAKHNRLRFLNLGGAPLLTNAAARQIGRMPSLEDLELGGWKCPITDDGFEFLQDLPNLRRLHSPWTRGLTDHPLRHLANCEHLREVALLGTPTGDGVIEALAGNRHLRFLTCGAGVTDRGIAALHEIPCFTTWLGEDEHFELTGWTAKPNHLILDGPFTNAGLRKLRGLDGLYGLTFFWHCRNFTSAGLDVLRHLPKLGFLGCQDAHCDDEAMRHVAAIPSLKMLMGQGAVASDDGFAELAASQTLECFWGREAPNFGNQGFTAISRTPVLRGVATSLAKVDDAVLALLPKFPALRHLMPMDVPDAAFRHIGACEKLERLVCMYCRDTGDEATAHLAPLRQLRHYYAGSTRITDRSLQVLGTLLTLETVEFWQCPGITDSGIEAIASLPNLKKVSMGGLANVTRRVMRMFSPGVRVEFEP